MTWSNFTEPRCSTCSAILVHAGAICFNCDEFGHYEAPIRTAPLLVMPPELDDADDDASETGDATVTQMADWRAPSGQGRRPVA